MTLLEKELRATTLADVLEQSSTMQEFKRQYRIDVEPTFWWGLLDSEKPTTKVCVTLCSLILFTTVVITGGFVTKWCEYNRYDEVVSADILFREEIRNALNSSELFDELDTQYTSWLLENPWTDAKSLFYWLSLMTTIGYGNMYPITSAGRLWTGTFGIFSILTSGLLVRALGNTHKGIITHTETFKKYPKTCLSILFISSALIFALLFWLIERDTGIRPTGDEGWSYGESFYFVIVTITTVGFGDFVPTTIITVFLIIYSIIMLSMLIGELKIQIRRIESDMREVIELAENSYVKATNSGNKSEVINSMYTPCGTSGVEMQISSKQTIM